MKAIKHPIHTLVLLLIIVSFICTGLLLWQNAPSTPALPAVQNKKVAPKATIPKEVDKVAQDLTLGSGFAIAYPKTWQLAHVGASDPTSKTTIQSDQTTLTSPSRKLQVILNVQTNISTRSTCTSDYIKLKYLKTDILALPSYKQGRFAAYVVYFPSLGLYQYHIGLQKNTTEIRGVTLENNLACNFMFGEFIQRKSRSAAIPLTHTLLAIRVPSLGDGNSLKPGVTEKDVAAALTGAEYEQAKKIVESVHIK